MIYGLSRTCSRPNRLARCGKWRTHSPTLENETSGWRQVKVKRLYVAVAAGIDSNLNLQPGKYTKKKKKKKKKRSHS